MKLERLARYLFLSNTLGKSLGVHSPPAKTGYLLRWKEGKLEGTIKGVDFLAIVSSALVSSGLMYESRRDTMRKNTVYSTAIELSEKALELAKGPSNLGEKTVLTNIIKFASERLKESRK